MVPPALVVSEVSAVPVPPPTAPENVVVPPVLTVSAFAPSTVDPSVIAPLPVLLSVTSPPRVIGPPEISIPTPALWVTGRMPPKVIAVPLTT